jgi:hypothetical protein
MFSMAFLALEELSFSSNMIQADDLSIEMRAYEHVRVTPERRRL